MSPDVIGGYLTAGRSLSPWIDNAVWFALQVLPGIGFVALVLAVWVGLAATVRGIRTRITSRRRTRWHIEDLEDYANDPDDPRFSNIAARKEDTL